jgi:hypothetical protein
MSICQPKYEFDGHKFGEWAGNCIWAIEMAYRARRGDKVAANILNTFKVTIESHGGKVYWPMTDADKLNEEARKWDSGEWKPTDPGWKDAPEAIPNKGTKWVRKMPVIEILHQLDDPGTWRWRVFIDGVQYDRDYDTKEEAESFAASFRRGFHVESSR